jgi:hypothetical protein
MLLSLGRRAAVETIGTAFLLAAIVGSGVMGDQLASGNVAVALLANTIATASALLALIDTFAGIRPVDVPIFLLGQIAGLSLAVALLHWLLPRAIEQGLS